VGSDSRKKDLGLTGLYRAQACRFLDCSWEPSFNEQMKKFDIKKNAPKNPTGFQGRQKIAQKL
jgi:hypothetical protein